MTSVNDGRPLIAYFFLPSSRYKGLRTASGHIRLHRDTPSFEPWSPAFVIPVANDGFVVPPFLPEVVLSILGVVGAVMRHVHESIEETVTKWTAPQMLTLRAFTGTPTHTDDAAWREETRTWWRWMKAAPAMLVREPAGLDDALDE